MTDPSRKQALISLEKSKKLFSNLFEILDITFSLLNAFEEKKRQGKEQIIGEVFLKMVKLKNFKRKKNSNLFKKVDSFKVYTTYCIHYVEAPYIIESCRQNNPYFSQWEKVIHYFTLLF